MSYILAAVTVLHLSGICEAGRSTVASSSATYVAFRQYHRGMEADAESVELFAEREALFHASVAEVAAHNAQKKSWTMKVNQFADFTPREMRAMMGYKRVGGRWAEAAGEGSSFLQTSGFGHQDVDVSSLSKVVDWRGKLNFSNFVHNQGACGSCWAHAAVGALQAHAELATGLQQELSTQEVIDCSPNPRHCGGTGGCHGATAEIAYELARNRGISLSKDYKGEGGKCPEAGQSALTVKGFVRLAENKASHLMQALDKQGPVVMSVDAENMFLYNDGVFSGCKQDAIVNHAVLGVGYGTDEKSGKDYWLIKNSWGGSWGEKGYFRMQRFTDDDAYCGTDNKPKDGVYCDDAPASIRVCGMCGSTSDSAYPVVASKTSLRQVSRANLSPKL
jgi:cathepsin L